MYVLYRFLKSSLKVILTIIDDSRNNEIESAIISTKLWTSVFLHEAIYIVLVVSLYIVLKS